MCCRAYDNIRSTNVSLVLCVCMCVRVFRLSALPHPYLITQFSNTPFFPVPLTVWYAEVHGHVLLSGGLAQFCLVIACAPLVSKL